MKRLREWSARNFPAGGFTRSVSLLAAGTAGGQAFALLAAPLLTRIYSPADFGHLQVYVSIMSFAMLTSTWRYELAIPLPDKDEGAAEVLAVTLCVLVIMVLAYAGAVWWIGGHATLPGPFAALQPYLWMIPIAILGGGAYQAISYWSLRQKNYAQVAGTRLTQVASQIVVQLAAGGLFSAGVMGLLLGDTIGRINGCASLARLAWRRHHEIFRRVRLVGMRGVASHYRHFPLISTVSGLVNTAGFAVPVLLIADFYGAQVLGWFALVSRLLAAPATLVGQAISQVYMSEAARGLHSDPRALQRLFLDTLRRLAWLGAVPCALFVIAAPPLFAFVFGEEWREAGHYARLLAVMYYMSLVAGPLMPTLSVLEKQGWQLLWDAGRLALTTGAIWLAFRWGWSARGAISIYGAAMFAAYAGHVLLSYFAILRHSNARAAPAP